MTIHTRNIKMLKTQANKVLSDISSNLDKDSQSYLMSYFDDDSNDFSKEGLFDFLEPLLEEAQIEKTRIEDICNALAELNPNQLNQVEVGERKLENSIQMHDSISATLHLSGKKIGDIRHTISNRGPEKSLVDQRKLRNAEKKIEEKRKARGMYNGEVIPEWNPSVVPQMVVNQAKRQVAADSRSKDIKLEDFDIQFAGKKILQNANLLLANGRRYGLVGKNGIGKSTL